MDDMDIPKDNSQISEEELREVLREALKMKIEHRDNKISKEKLRGILSSMLTEFLSCYKLIGFDMEGNLTIIEYVSKDIHKAALETAYLEELKSVMDRKGGSNKR